MQLGIQKDEAIASRNLLVTYIFSLFPIVVYIATKTVNFYAEPDFPSHTYGTLYVAFFCTFSVFLLIPIDVASTVRDRNAGAQDDSTLKYKDDTGVLRDIYFAFYIVLLIMTNVILAVQEYYNTDGYFTPGTRARSSWRRWLNDTVPAAIIGVVVLGLLMGSHAVPSTPSGLKIVVVCLTNAIYETMLMFLLGYGLVELPKSYWLAGNIEQQLLFRQIKAATDLKAFQDAQIDVQKNAASCLKTKEKLGTGGEAKVMEALSILLAECPQEFKSARGGDVAVDKKTGKVTLDSLAELRTRLNVTKATYRMAQARLESTQMGAYIYEDLVEAKARNNRRSGKYDGNKVINWQLKGTSGTTGEYRWLIERKPVLCRVAAVCLGSMSLLCIIGGISSMHEVPKQTSLFFVAVHSAGASRAGIATFVLMTFGYLVLVAIWSLLQLRSLGFELVKGRTTPYSLSACFRMVASLAYPLTFFYLGWTGENGTESDGKWMYFSEPRNRTFATTRPMRINTGIYYTNTTKYSPRLHRNVTISKAHNGSAIVHVPAVGWRLEPDYMPCAFAQMYKLPPATNYAFGTVYPIALLIFLIMFASTAYNRLCVCLKCPTYQFGDPVVTKEQLDEGMKSLNKWRKIAQRTVQRQELSRMRAARDADRSIKIFGCVLWRRETLREIDERKEREEREMTMRMRASEMSGSSRKGAKKESDAAVAHLEKPPDLSRAAQIRSANLKPAGPSEPSVVGSESKKKDKPKWVDAHLELVPPDMLYVLANAEAANEDPPTLSRSLPAPVQLTEDITVAKVKPDKDGRHGVKLSTCASSSGGDEEEEEDEGEGEGKGKGAKRELFRIRFLTEDEAESWRSGLDDWKEYARTHAQEVKKYNEKQEADRVAAELAERAARFKAEADIEAALHEEERRSASVSARLSHSLRSSMMRRSSMSTSSGGSDKINNKRSSFTTNPMRLAGAAAAIYDVSRASAQFHADVSLEVRPDTVEGWLELKSFTKVWLGPKYKRYYFRIHEGSHSMQYFHFDEGLEDASPVGYVDLRVAGEALQSKKYGDSRDACRFTCQVHSLVFVFKAPQASEARLWVRLINLWREYLLLKLTHLIGPQSEKRISLEREEKGRAAEIQRLSADNGDGDDGEDEDDNDGNGNGATASTVEMTTTSSAESAADSVTSTDNLLTSPPQPPSATVAASSPKKKLDALRKAPRASQALSPSLLMASGIAVQAGALSKGLSRRRSSVSSPTAAAVAADDEKKGSSSGPGGEETMKR